MKQKIRPIYSELQGYLSQAPNQELLSFIKNDVFWNQINNTIEELSYVSKKNYDNFKINPETNESDQYIDTIVCRLKLGGLIAKLHGEFFSDEPAPFSGMPSTAINLTQNQNQTVQIEILLNMQAKICEKINQYEVGSKERSFLEKVKVSLKSVSNIVQLVLLLLKTGKEIGLTIEQMLSIFY